MALMAKQRDIKEEIDVEEAIKELGDNWQEEAEKQVSLLQAVTGRPISFDKEHNTLTVNFEGLEGRDAVDMIITELIAKSKFGQASLADLFGLVAYTLAKAKAEGG